ncbi:MAG: DUF4476 domain-containing protein [Bacteroidota bacterium]|nr:DUF4476 domain-containing protein [Bacteroidota bacterium]
MINEHEAANVLALNIMDDTVTIQIDLSNNSKAQKKIYLLEKGKVTINKEFNYKVENIKNKLVISFVNVSEIQKLIDPIVPPKPIIDTSNKYRNNILGHFCEIKNDIPIFFNNLPKQGTCSVPMPMEYLNYTALLINKAEVPDDKYNILENVVRNNCISIDQLSSMLKYIDYEVEKLKLIKQAYFHFSDKSNSKKLENSFTYESSKTELDNFLNEVKTNKQILNSACEKQAEDIEIKSFLEKLSVLGNDAERFQNFKKLYTNYCYSSAQAKQVIQVFIHDREKLDVAQLLYYYCTDKQNFNTISDIFSYKQTESDLQDFIEKQK